MSFKSSKRIQSNKFKSSENFQYKRPWIQASDFTWRNSSSCYKFFTIWSSQVLKTCCKSTKQLLLILQGIYDRQMKQLSYFNWSRNYKEMSWNRKVMLPSHSPIQIKIIIPSLSSKQLQVSKLFKFNFLPNQSSSHGKKSKLI